ncbi:adenylate/guanylate cyclase domain-containing protein, partial [bacterium]|nr:adenylate/guanylate cyclase domain-containing protein [bacterium]
IRGFTSICEDVEPERIILALNLYFDQMVPIIENWKGSLDKLIGDCIMAVFEESDGFRESEAALNCAIEMQALMEFVRDDLRSQNLPEFHVGFGVNTGPSVVGNLGAKSQLSRTVLGDSVNLAARVEALSKDGIESKVLFTEFTLEQLRIAPRHKLLMETIVKGKTNLVKVFEVDSEEVALKRSSMRTD